MKTANKILDPMESPVTSGPWKAVRIAEANWKIVGPANCYIAEVNDIGPMNDQKGNAQVLGSAREMYDLLIGIEVLARANCPITDQSPMHHAIVDIIKKIKTGGANGKANTKTAKRIR